MPPLLPLLLPLVLLAACAAGPVRSAPASVDGLVVVFADDFHSGVILAQGDSPAELLPAGGMGPWVAFHFGERGFITGAAAGGADALRLGVLGGAGGVQADALTWWVHDRGGTDRAQVRVWAFPAAADELAGVRERLRAWVDPEVRPSILAPGSCWHPARRRWTLATNCHDFTADVLAGAGIRLDGTPIRMAAGLRQALDRSWSERDRR